MYAGLPNDIKRIKEEDPQIKHEVRYPNNLLTHVSNLAFKKDNPKLSVHIKHIINLRIVCSVGDVL
jgi:hypothetical protein